MIKIAQTSILDLDRTRRGIQLHWRRKNKWILQDRKIKSQTNTLIRSGGDAEAISQFLRACSHYFVGRISPGSRDAEQQEPALAALDGNLQGTEKEIGSYFRKLF